MKEFTAIAEIVNSDKAKTMFEIIERSSAVRRIIYAAYGVGYLFGLAALANVIAPLLK